MDGKKQQQYLSQIPDEVVCYILSKLDLKEAARTSVISRGWKYLWSYAVYDLNFDSLRKPRFQEELVEHEKAWYVSWVNKVLGLLRVPTIEHFRVEFCLDKSCAEDIDRWIRYAFEKRVKRLELDFSSVLPRGKELYPFPDISCPIERVQFFRSGHWTLTTLYSLSLKGVQVSSQVLEFFVSNCPLLEQFCIDSCENFTHLRISGSSICLKHLKIYHCEEMTSLEIHAPNLLSFDYLRPDYIEETDILIHNTRKLAKLTLADASSHMLQPFSDCCSNLEELILDYLFPPQILHIFGDGKLPRLKKILLRVCGDYGEGLLDVTRDLVFAAPHLEEYRVSLCSDEPELQRERQPADILTANSRPHKSLKLVEIMNCTGGIVDAELAMFLSVIAISLEKMVLAPRLVDYEDDIGSNTVQLSQELKAILPSQTNVVILW